MTNREVLFVCIIAILIFVGGYATRYLTEQGVPSADSKELILRTLQLDSAKAELKWRREKSVKDSINSDQLQQQIDILWNAVPHQ